jgi:hypothetical protein
VTVDGLVFVLDEALEVLAVDDLVLLEVAGSEVGGLPNYESY